MKNFIIPFLVLLFLIFILFDCAPKERQHLNPYDPEYVSTNTSSGGGSGGTSFSSGVISFNSNTYIGTNAKAIITLSDADLTNATQDVNVKSDSDLTGITLTLYKTVSTYTGVLLFAKGSSIPNSKIKVSYNDTVTVTYNDANPLGVRTDTATWITNVSGGSGSGSSNTLVLLDDTYHLASDPGTGMPFTTTGAGGNSSVVSIDNIEYTEGSASLKWVFDLGSAADANIQMVNTWPPDGSGATNLSVYYGGTIHFSAKADQNLAISFNIGAGFDTGIIGARTYVNLTTTWQDFTLQFPTGDALSDSDPTDVVWAWTTYPTDPLNDGTLDSIDMVFQIMFNNTYAGNSGITNATIYFDNIYFSK